MRANAQRGTDEFMCGIQLQSPTVSLTFSTVLFQLSSSTLQTESSIWFFLPLNVSETSICVLYDVIRIPFDTMHIMHTHVTHVRQIQRNKVDERKRRQDPPNKTNERRAKKSHAYLTRDGNR